jgi:phosphomannomutase/phosphoglucomutase
VVVDAGNGAGGPLALATHARRWGSTPTPLYCEMDGRFPNHHPDPTLPENVELIARVRETGADVGIAFDGDADRIGAVDAQRRDHLGRQAPRGLRRAVLARHPGAAVLGEVKCSQTLYDDIAQHGGRPIMWKTGHSLIKAKMKEEHALLAGEMSGTCSSPTGTSATTTRSTRRCACSRSSPPRKVSLAEMLADLPKTFVTPEIRVPCPDEVKFQVVSAGARALPAPRTPWPTSTARG